MGNITSSVGATEVGLCMGKLSLKWGIKGLNHRGKHFGRIEMYVGNASLLVKSLSSSLRKRYDGRCEMYRLDFQAIIRAH